MVFKICQILVVEVEVVIEVSIPAQGVGHRVTVDHTVMSIQMTTEDRTTRGDLGKTLRVFKPY